MSVTQDEFKKTMSQLDEIVDQLTQSENVDAEDSLNDAACLTKLKVEITQNCKEALFFLQKYFNASKQRRFITQ